jgi:hypothetical protein
MSGNAAVWVRSLQHKTVWSRSNTAKIPPRYWLLYTVVLPYKYIAIGLYGALSVGFPVTSIDLMFGELYGNIWSVMLAVCGFGAFLGISFYNRLIWMEAMATVMLVTLMVLYIGCIFLAAAFNFEQFRFLSLLLVMIFLPMPSWRVYDIVRELRPPRVL